MCVGGKAQQLGATMVEKTKLGRSTRKSRDPCHFKNLGTAFLNKRTQDHHLQDTWSWDKKCFLISVRKLTTDFLTFLPAIFFTLLPYKNVGSSLAEEEEQELWPQRSLGSTLALSPPAVTLERVAEPLEACFFTG